MLCAVLDWKVNWVAWCRRVVSSHLIHLSSLFVADCIEGIDGIPCYGYGVIRNKEVVHIPYPIDEETQQKSVGKSFHHGRFISSLRKAAKSTKK